MCYSQRKKPLSRIINFRVSEDTFRDYMQLKEICKENKIFFSKEFRGFLHKRLGKDEDE
jgi:hypothetical protein